MVFDRTTRSRSDASPTAVEASVTHRAPAPRTMAAATWRDSQGRELVTAERPGCLSPDRSCRVDLCQPPAALPPCDAPAAAAPGWSELRARAPSQVGTLVNLRGHLLISEEQCTNAACAPYVCCNSCVAAALLVTDGEAIGLAQRTCAGRPPLVGCNVPADGREVVASGTLSDRGPNGVEYWLEEPSLCQLSGGPETGDAPPPCYIPCDHVFEATIPLPAVVTLSELGSSRVIFCHDDDCVDGSLQDLVNGPGACIVRRPAQPWGHGVSIELRPCGPSVALVVSADGPPGRSPQDGDSYRLELRSPSGRPLFLWSKRVSYTRGATQPDGSRCMSVRFGLEECDRVAPKLSWCPCRCAPGDTLCACWN
jgi:hypothetical protein